MQRRTRKNKGILPDKILRHVVRLEKELGGDRPRRRIQVSRDVHICRSANYAGLPIGQLKLLHKQIIRLDDRIGIEIQEFLNKHRFPVRQPRDLQSNPAAIGVAG